MPRIPLPSWDPYRFTTARQAKGWTLAQVARASGIRTSQIHKYSAGRTAPPPHALVKIAQALDVHTTDLAPMSDPPRLHELRWHAGLSVAEVAERVGLSQGYAAGILRGETEILKPDIWAKALGVSAKELLQAWTATNEDLLPPG